MSFYQRLQRVAATFAVAVALLLAVSACDNTVTDPGLEEEEDPEEVVVTDDAVVVDQESTPIQRVAGDTLIFQLSDSSPAFEPGNVVVGEEGEGFLRRVVEVDVSGDEAVLITEEASLVDVVERGTLQESFDLSTTTRAGLEWQVTHIEEGVTADAGALGLELEEVDLPGITGLSVTFTNGSVSFDPDIDFQLEIRRGRLNEMLIAASGQLDFNVDVEVTASQEIVRKDSTLLARFDGQPITFFIGFVPVVILPTLEFIAGYEVGLGQEGSITSGLESLNAITAGAEYSNGNWSPILDRSNTLEPRPLIWDQTASAEAKGYIRPKLSFTVYGVAGPFINSNGYVRTQATISPPSWAWGVFAGLDGNFGGEVKIFDNVLAKYEHTFAQVEWELAGESGEVGGEVEATLTGQITDVETGQGVEGASIIGTDPSSGEEFLDTVTDATGAYATTFTVEEAPENLTVEVQADAYEAVEQAISFEEEMTLDLELKPVDDPEGGEATISGQITDADTDNGIEDATVTGTDLATGNRLFETSTDVSGDYETTFTVNDAPDEIEVVAIAEGYETGAYVISFAEDIRVDLSLDPNADKPLSDIHAFAGARSGLVVAYDRSGTQAWQRSFEESIQSLRNDANERLFAATGDGFIHVIDDSSGELIDSFNTGEEISAMTIGQSGYVYVANNSIVRRLTPEFEEDWMVETQVGDIQPSALVVDVSGYVYSGGSDNKVQKISPTGDLMWTYEGSDTPRSLAVDHEGYVYIGWRRVVGGKGISKLNSQGSQVWSIPLANNSNHYGIDVDENYVYIVGSLGRKIRKFDKFGAEIWSMSTDGNGYSLVVDKDGYVNVAHVRGRFQNEDGEFIRYAPNGEVTWIDSVFDSRVTATATRDGVYGAGFWDE